MNNKKKIYFIEVLLLLYTIFYKVILKKYFFKYVFFLNLLFWIILILIFVIKYGFPKDKKYYRNTTIRDIIIILLLYVLISYLLSLFTGFSRTVFDRSLIGIIKNILPLIINAIVMEIFRFLILKRINNKSQTVLLVAIMVVFNLIAFANFSGDFSKESVFLYFSIIFCPLVAREAIYTYLTKNISIYPTIILRIFIECFVYFPTLLPGLGNYLTSVFETFLPYIIYRQVKRNVEYKEKNNRKLNLYYMRYVAAIVVIFLGVLVTLVSGIFKYKMIGIVSNSMNPVYYRGDAVIFEKMEADDIQVEDILVFKNNNELITHRVVNITEYQGKRRFITKGDNNESEDTVIVFDEHVVGVVRKVVKYIAYPTVWFNE